MIVNEKELVASILEASALLEAQSAEIERLLDVNAGMKIDIRGLRDCIKTQAAEIMRLREALAFYANGMEPFGNTARNALENKP